jgi:Mce-associated membrane protein
VAGLRRPAPGDQQRPEPAETTDLIPKIEDERPATEPERAGARPAEPTPDPVDRPRPSGKRRPRPTPRPVGEDVEPVAEPVIEDAEPVRRAGLKVPALLAVAVLVIGGLAAWFGVEWTRVSSGDGNTALTDSATTSQVSGQVTSAVNTVFSYNYANLAKTQRAVHQVLTGTALCQYDELFSEIKQQAPKQKLVLTTTVVAKGVSLLQGDTARVVMEVHQHDTRATTNQTSDAKSVLAVNAIRQGDTWKISSFDTFNSQNPTACK